MPKPCLPKAEFSQDERDHLFAIIHKGTYGARVITRARILSKLDEKQAAMITAIACSDAPDGRSHWTLRMLGAKIVELGFAESYSHESVRQLLKKTNSSLGKSKNGASPK